MLPEKFWRHLCGLRMGNRLRQEKSGDWGTFVQTFEVRMAAPG